MIRKAKLKDTDGIWRILQQAIERRKSDGSIQWQDGYPNPQVVEIDINNEYGYVLTIDDEIAAYVAMMVNNEPAYDEIEGEWLTQDSDFLVIHRVAIENNWLGKGLAKRIFEDAENVAKDMNIKSIRVDTNYDNLPLLHILDKLGYVYCGEVFFRGSPRKAFVKILIK